MKKCLKYLGIVLLCTLITLIVYGLKTGCPNTAIYQYCQEEHR